MSFKLRISSNPLKYRILQMTGHKKNIAQIQKITITRYFEYF